MVEPELASISIQRQCELLSLARSSFYYEPGRESPENLQLMRLLDEQYLRTPFYGIARLTAWLRSQGQMVNHKRVERLMRLMGIQAIYPKPRLSQTSPANNRVYPYLLRGVNISRVNQVWSTDITYVRLRQGFLYLVAILDWFSRYVVSWQLSNSLDTSFCLLALNEALEKGRPEVFNSDQGCHFTSREFTERLEMARIQISMDGRGRVFDNIFIERLWRSVKYEEVFLKDYQVVADAESGLGNYFEYYNQERLHQSLGYQTPASIYYGR
jgi:putative transposase